MVDEILRSVHFVVSPLRRGTPRTGWDTGRHHEVHREADGGPCRGAGVVGPAGVPPRVRSVKAVVDRVSRAAVRVDGAIVGEIDGEGLLVLLGVHRDDTTEAVWAMARKLHELRILARERSCAETGAPLLVVSQFTLCGDTSKGRRPSWSAA